MTNSDHTWRIALGLENFRSLRRQRSSTPTPIGHVRVETHTVGTQNERSHPLVIACLPTTIISVKRYLECLDAWATGNVSTIPKAFQDTKINRDINPCSLLSSCSLPRDYAHSYNDFSTVFTRRIRFSGHSLRVAIQRFVMSPFSCWWRYVTPTRHKMVWWMVGRGKSSVNQYSRV